MLSMTKPNNETKNIKLAVREAEKASTTGGTGYTILKLRLSPIARLVEQHKIGPEELQAAKDISTAFFALSGGLGIKPQCWEKRDRSHHNDHWPASIAQSVENYQRFAKHWSIRAKCGDPTLEIIIAAVIDERAATTIEADVGIGRGRATKAIVAGLRDYAVRAGWVSGRQAQAWTEQAANVFRIRHPDLRLAMARSRVS